MTSKDDDRAQRMAAALRDNLRRRKAQARATQDAPPEPAEIMPAAPAPSTPRR